MYADSFTYEGFSQGFMYESAIATMLEGPDAEDYWWAWDAVLSAAYYIENPSLRLHQDGDVFLGTAEELNELYEYTE
jgi:hypothetical protein